MIRLKLAAVLAAVTVLASPAAAQRQGRVAEPRPQYGIDDPIILDPAKAYILYRTPTRQTYRFLREVSESERAEWLVARAAALVTERERYVRRLSRWERDRQQCVGNASGLCTTPEARPVEPTDDNFAFPPPEADNFAENAIRPRLDANEQWSIWLIAVEPGTYTLYGAMTLAPNGSMGGQCFCMGSVRFDVRPGEITDMGEVQAPATDQLGEVTATTFHLGHFATVTPTNPTLRTPARLSGVRMVPAVLRAADKLPNYFGIMVSRLAPIPGVLDYRRDVVIDARSGLPVDQPTSASTRLR